MEEPKEKYWGPKLWEDLRSADPKNVCDRGKVHYEDEVCYVLTSLERTVRIYPGEERFESEDKTLAESADFQLLLLSYLLYAQKIDPAGNWVSEKDIKGGSLFFRGPHALPSAPLERRFGGDPGEFRRKALTLGGQELAYGDMAMSFPVLPRIPVAVVLWTQDEEFPARVTFMMDSSIEAHLPLDVIAAMVQSVTQKLIEE